MGRSTADFKPAARLSRFSRQADRRLARATFETLEERRLMSLTILVRNADGSSTGVANSVGQVINLNVLAVVTDTASAPTADGLQDVIGSFISSAVYGHAVAGNLTAANLTPFRASGAAAGTFQDLNSDGNIDVGSNTNANLFFARSSPLQTGSSGTGTISGSTLVFKIATMTYTVTNLNRGGQTNINFVPFSSPRPDAAAWVENGIQKDNLSGSFVAGSAYTISAPSLVVAPVAVNDTTTVTRNTTGTITELTNDDIIVPLNPASVTIVTAPAHGTTQLQTNGSIKYTPAADYVGADTFTYHVADTDGRVSNTATVSITVSLAPPPTATSDAATTLRNTPVTVSVLANDTSPATLTPASVVIGTAAAHGAAVAQTDGTVIYTPTTGFVGTDTFTYTVSDSNNETSAAGTVTVTVNAPVPPAPADDAYQTTAGAPITLDVLTNDASPSSPLVPGSLTIVTMPTHGTGAVQTDGTILYTPTAGFIGNDSLSYTIADAVGDVSTAAAVSISITHSVPPVATDVTAPVLADQPNIIDVLANVSSGAPVVPGSVAVVTAPVNGTATVNASTGQISYIPAAGFIGTDTFTYTAGNTNLDTTSPATVSVNVGTSISNLKGAAHLLTFVNAAGGLQTIALNKGSAQIFFTGTGSLTVAKSGKATVAGSGLNLASLTLAGTTRASVLSIRGSTKTPTTLAGLTDAAPLGSVIAQSVNMSGTINLNSIGTFTAGAISNATITVAAGAPGHLAFTAGAVTDSELASAVPITNLKVASWTNAGSTQIVAPGYTLIENATPGIIAPSIKSLTSTGAFETDIALSDAGKAGGLGTAKITGAVSGGLWNVSGGVKSVVAGSIAAGWGASVGGTLTSFSVKSGGFGSVIAAGAIGTLSVVGDMTSHEITAASLKVLKVTGAISGVTIAINGNIGAITAGSIATSQIVTSSAFLATAGGNLDNPTVNLNGLTSANVGGNTIGSIKTGSFASTTIASGKITSASLGTITTANGGSPFGLGAKSISNFTGIFASGPLKLGRASLASEELLQAYVNQQGAVFGDFAIAILT